MKKALLLSIWIVWLVLFVQYLVAINFIVFEKIELAHQLIINLIEYKMLKFKDKL